MPPALAGRARSSSIVTARWFSPAKVPLRWILAIPPRGFFALRCAKKMPRARNLARVVQVHRGEGGVHVRKIVDVHAFGECGSWHDGDGCPGGHRSGTASTEAGGNPALRPPSGQPRR